MRFTTLFWPNPSNERLNTSSENTSPKTESRAAGRTKLGWLVFLIVIAVCLLVWLWCVGFVYCLDDCFPQWLAKSIAGLIGIGFPLLFLNSRRNRRVPVITLGVVFVACLVGFKTMQPSHDRQWGEAQEVLPFAEFETEPSDASDTEDLGRSEFVTVNNIRATRYGPVAEGGPSRYNDTYDLAKLKSVWFGVDRFTEVEPLAHTFLSFEFEPGSQRSNFLAFSVETRREKDELMYSPIRGIFNNYEVIYVIADEQDVLSVRSDVQEHVVQLYPVRATQRQARDMFVDMLKRANSIRQSPEFYHTVTSNCTNNIVYHTNKVLDQPISPWQRGVVFPGYSDWLAYRLGIIDTELPLGEAREKFRIDQRVKAYSGQGDFSKFIRASD